MSILEEARFGEDELELEGLQFAPLGPRQFQLRTDIMAEDAPRHTGLQSALAESLGTITLFESSVIEKPTQDQMEGVLDNITNRVNRFGTEEPIIQIFGEDRLIVQLPGASGSITDIVLAESGEEADPDAARKNVDVFVDLPRVLTESGYEEFEIDFHNENTFTVQSNTVNSEIQANLLSSIVTEIGQVAQFNVRSGIDEAK